MVQTHFFSPVCLVFVAMVSTQNPLRLMHSSVPVAAPVPSGLWQEEGLGWQEVTSIHAYWSQAVSSTNGRLIDYAIVSLPAKNREWKIKYDREEGETARIIVAEVQQISKEDLYLVQTTLIALLL